MSNYSLPDLGSVAGLALYTDDGSLGPDKDEHASEQDPLPKPISVSKRASRRKAKKPPPQTAEVEVQTDLTFDCNEEIILVPLKPEDLQEESDGIDDYVDTVTEYEDTDSESEAEDVIAEELSCESETFEDLEPGESEGDHIDVELSAAEIKHRKHVDGIPDGKRFFECNPEDVELCPAEKRERRFRMRRGITMDSGAGDSVIPKRMINKERIRQSEGQKRGLHYVSCTDHRIPNEGEIDLEFTTTEGNQESWVVQVAEVNKPLGCVADRVDNRCRVTFDQDDDTGEDLTCIFNKKTKKKTMLRRIGKVWVLDAIVTADMVANEQSDFSRPR